MWQKILVWVLKFALSTLGENLDAETKAQVDEYNRRKTALEAQEKQSAVEIGLLDAENKNLETERKAKIDEGLHLAFENDELEAHLVKIRDENNKKLADLHNLGDDSLLHIKL